ncbi:hypothetical protein M3Y94_00957900 [Aphelenchoides besseyi]|nr:hypothetical protein M3Y94_00957900 [Aphelenchoides besseyi]KAI6224748.1 hypothetical protein M3Y95_00785200 [Aphelenchoides besseyi]
MSGIKMIRNLILFVCLIQLGLSATVRRDATAGLRDGCFPRPKSDGCRCAEKDKDGKEVSKLYETTAECTLKHDPQQIENKKTVLDELKTDVANLKENCYPRPSNIGCRCTEKDSTGHDVAKIYETDAECRTDAEPVERKKRDGGAYRADEKYAGDGKAHNELIGGAVRPEGAVAAGPEAEQSRRKRGDANISAEDEKPEVQESAVAIESPPDVEVKKAAAGGASETDDSDRVPRHGDDGKAEHHAGDHVHTGNDDGHDHSKDEQSRKRRHDHDGKGEHHEGDHVHTGDNDGHDHSKDAQSRKRRHGDDGKPEHHAGDHVHTGNDDGHDHSKDEQSRKRRHDHKEGEDASKHAGHEHKEPVGANVRPEGAAVSDDARFKRHDNDGKGEHHEGDGHNHEKQSESRLKRDVSAIPAGGADATAREASAGAASGGSIHPTTVPKPEDRPHGAPIGSEVEAKVMGEVAEHIDESARVVKREAVQPHDRPQTAGHGVYGAKHQHENLDQNVRDPVREKAAQNYQAVLNELKDKFRGLKEGCFPRPKGCLCVIGKDGNGRDLTERRMKDSDCKCQPGERGNGCPATGA